jgi:hypothetical protein
VTIVRYACTIKAINDTSWSIIDDCRVLIHIVVSPLQLSDNHYIFIVQASVLAHFLYHLNFSLKHLHALQKEVNARS